MKKVIASYLIVFCLLICLITVLFRIIGKISLFYFSSWLPTLAAVITLIITGQGSELKSLFSSFRVDKGLKNTVPMLLLYSRLTSSALIIFIIIFGLKNPFSLGQILANIPLLLFTGARVKNPGGGV